MLLFAVGHGPGAEVAVLGVGEKAERCRRAIAYDLNVGDDAVDAGRRHLVGEVEAAIEKFFIYAGVDRVEEELLPVHRAGAAIGGVHGRAHPVEITADAAIDHGMDVSGLGNEHGAHSAGEDGLSEFLRGRCPERLVDVGEMLAVELVEVAVVGGVMFGTVPPVPVAALGDQQLFVSQVAVLVGGAWESSRRTCGRR